jgi:hypothetical protein
MTNKKGNRNDNDKSNGNWNYCGCGCGSVGKIGETVGGAATR